MYIYFVKLTKIYRSLARLVTLAFIAITLSSCGPTTDYSLIIENASSMNLRIVRIDSTLLSNAFFDGRNPLIFPGNSEKVIGIDTGIGTTESYANCPRFHADSIRLTTFSGDSIILNIDLNSSEAYTFAVTSAEEDGGGVCECRVVITDDLIQ